MQFCPDFFLLLDNGTRTRPIVFGGSGVNSWDVIKSGNLKNPYLSSLVIFQKIITPERLNRLTSYFPRTCILIFRTFWHQPRPDRCPGSDAMSEKLFKIDQFSKARSDLNFHRIDSKFFVRVLELSLFNISSGFFCQRFRLAGAVRRVHRLSGSMWKSGCKIFKLL